MPTQDRFAPAAWANLGFLTFLTWMVVFFLSPALAAQAAPPQGEGKGGSSAVLFSPMPGAPDRFHRLHPINPAEGCVSGKCHAIRKTVKYAHAPVATGACIVCHSDMTPKRPLGLTTRGSALCLKCHKEQQSRTSRARFVHKPVRQDCTGCHNAHGSQDSKFFLLKRGGRLCASCHQNRKKAAKVIQITTGRKPHKPVAEGKCTACHAPHVSNYKKLLRKGPKDVRLCFTCHDKKAAKINKAAFKYGPIRDGLCSGCHVPHGADEPKLLRYYYVRRFYNPYDPRLYALCFKCHKDTLVKDERTTALTHFRNGDRNLHYLHVHRKKGRTCLACHQVHAGPQERSIRRATPFGEWQIPVQFQRNQSGGKCLATCHLPKEYDRIKPRKLLIDSQPAPGKDTSS